MELEKFEEILNSTKPDIEWNYDIDFEEDGDEDSDPEDLDVDIKVWINVKYKEFTISYVVENTVSRQEYEDFTTEETINHLLDNNFNDFKCEEFENWSELFKKLNEETINKIVCNLALNEVEDLLKKGL